MSAISGSTIEYAMLESLPSTKNNEVGFTNKSPLNFHQTFADFYGVRFLFGVLRCMYRAMDVRHVDLRAYSMYVFVLST
jgi:hypothetical protein